MPTLPFPIGIGSANQEISGDDLFVAAGYFSTQRTHKVATRQKS